MVGPATVLLATCNVIGQQHKTSFITQQERGTNQPTLRIVEEKMMQSGKRLRAACERKWALVTGASAGIGLAMATQLAAAGANLVLTARRKDRLEKLAERLEGQYGIQTRVVVADLADPAAPDQLFAATEGSGLAVDVLINNAGFGYLGEFAKSDPAWQRTMVDVNCAAVVHLTRLFLPRMMERRRGYIMIVSSTASYQPVPFMSTYAATKVFDRFLAEALAYEASEYGVKVSALCPGPTESEFHEIAGSRNQFGRGRQSADEVARMGLEGLIGGRHWVIPDRAGRAMIVVERFLPRRWISALAARAFRPKRSSR